jgi:hypothetical protein
MMRRWLRAMIGAGSMAFILGTAATIEAQVVSVQDLFRLEDFEHDSGSTVAPIFHGWETNADGTASLYFGYLNRNWKEEMDIPLGPNNFFEPGPQDRGQPAHFLPRLHKNIFKIDVPKNFKGQFVWTLTMRGKTEKVKATLDPTAEINFTHFPQQKNTPPRVTSIEPSQTIVLPQTATLRVTVVDDGLPSPQGLKVEWYKYRGPGKVTFADAVPKINQGTAVTTASFSEPGVYMLQVLGDDGSRSAPTSECCWTTAVTTVTVRSEAGQKP